MLHKLSDPSRYWAVLKWYGRDLVRFGQWWLDPPSHRHACALFPAEKERHKGGERDGPSLGRWPSF